MSAKSQAKREAILRSAATVFKDRGYLEASMAEIASNIGTFAGSLYYHFPSKAVLAEEVLNFATTDIARQIESFVDDLPDDAPWREKIRLALRAHHSQVLERDDFIIAYWKIIDHVPEDVRSRQQSKPDSYYIFWGRLIDEAIKAGEIRDDLDPSIIRMLLIGGTIWGSDWFGWGLHVTDRDSPVAPDRLADEMISILFDGIAP